LSLTAFLLHESRAVLVVWNTNDPFSFLNDEIDKEIANVLITKRKKQNEEYKKRIYELEQEKIKNKNGEEVNIKTCSLPDNYSSKKVMRYEKSLQKSIFQNLSILKKLQSFP
jgi:hypothetical protein